MYEDFLKNLDKGQQDLQTLIDDVSTMSASKNPSKKSLEPMSRLRKDVSEIETAKKNPDETFINDKLNDIMKNIFGGE